MGGCTSKNSTQTDISYIIDRTWMKESKNIDKFVYENSIDLEKSLKLQLTFTSNIHRLDFPQDFEIEDEFALNIHYIQTYKDLIIKGIPNNKLSGFLFSLFKMRIVDYQTHDATLFSEPENERLKGVEKSSFGRNKITSNMLNMKGANSMNKILFLIRTDYPNLQYCPILPRVVQFFLWYVPEKVALKMVVLLLEENLKLEDSVAGRSPKANSTKYFSTNLKFNKYLKNLALSKCRNVEDKRMAKVLLEEIIDNMCVTVVPGEYLTLVFVGFLMSGILFIANLAGNLYNLIVEYKKKTIPDIKYVLKDLNLYEIIIKSHKIGEGLLKRMDSSQGSFSEMCSYVPTLDKPSLIFNTSEKRNQLFSLIPKVHMYRSMKKVFSFDQNGLLISELNYFWRKNCTAFVLFINVGNKIIGLFVDNDLETLERGIFESCSFYFEYENKFSVFTHEKGKELKYSFQQPQGILIGSSKSPILNLDYSLLDVQINKQDTFSRGDENLELLRNLSIIMLPSIREDENSQLICLTVRKESRNLKSSYLLKRKLKEIQGPKMRFPQQLIEYLRSKDKKKVKQVKFPCIEDVIHKFSRSVEKRSGMENREKIRTPLRQRKINTVNATK